ncbi:hypothetical protein TEA_012005 [Camellia sinensis var. sinensis]|uniref:Uncharacterized protein n=1 Tax=Camellia sinensis var. sinensis TaxID=542762 RepID=A0A4S4DV77_CAMSN|nr:hypothetical protein TEA_012005 [Camellia sinensis var. sinensis]
MNYLPEGFSKCRTVAGTGARCSLVHLITSITITSVFKLGLPNREFHGEWPLAVARFSSIKARVYPSIKVLTGVIRANLEPKKIMQFVDKEHFITTDGSTQVRNRHPRGLTRGLKVQAMVQKDGKLKVPIPQEYLAPVGDHASQLVSKIGVEKQSNANIDNRNQLKTKHRCGSKSLPVRVHEATIANGGQLPELPCVYKSTHFNDVTKQWISPECEKNYDNMIKIQAEHCSEPGVVPITLEELSVKVLKPRSGYVKGLGLRRSFSVRTTSASTDSDYVRHLEMEIQKQKEEIQSQKEKIQSHKEEITAQKHEIQVQKEEIQAQNKEIRKMNGSIDEHFEITPSIMEFLKKQGFKG